MYCKKCGKNIEDAPFCPDCGTPSGQVNIATETSSALGNTVSVSNKKANFLPFILIILVLAGGFLWWTSPKRTAKKLLNKMADAIEDNDTEKLIECFPDAYADLLSNSLVSGVMEYALEESHDQLADIYGKKFSIKIKVTDTEKMNKKERKEAEENLESSLLYWSDEKVEISKAYTVTYDITIKGKDDKNTLEDCTVVLAKMDGEWKLTSLIDLD